MSLEDHYIQAGFSLLGIEIALAGEVPKRSGDFETSYKTETGKEVVVKRSPDGKFANKNAGTASRESTTATASVGKVFGKSVAGFKLGQSIKDELAKKPFSKFAETVTAKFEEFRKDLPQKSDDLRKEIVRIAKDPNTSAHQVINEQVEAVRLARND